MNKDTEEVLAIERGFWTEASNREFYEEHLADSAISVMEPMGAIEKRQALEMTAPAPWDLVEMRDVIVRQVTPELIVLAYHGAGRRPTDGKPYQGSIASAYAKIDGRWQLAMTSHQPWTPKPAKASKA